MTKRTPLPILILAIGVLLGAPALGAPMLVPSPPTLEARAYYLQDLLSGKVLAESNAEERMEPASLTKIMTAYVVFSELEQGNIKLSDKALISEKARNTPGSRMFVEVGSRVTVEDLLKGMIVQSGNDASVALAEFIAGTEAGFVDLMNQHAANLGLTGTRFMNADGLPDPDHYTTARDLAVMTRALISRFPDYYAWHAIREFTYNGIKQKNRNKLLWQDESVDGVKTGYTSSAGYTMVVSAARDGTRLVSVILGAKSGKARARQARSLLDFGFRFFETHKLYRAGEPVTQTRVWKGNAESLGVGLLEDLYVTVPRGQYPRLKAVMELDEMVVAPVAQGSVRGTVRVSLGEERVAERALVALQSVSEGNLWRRLSDQLRLLFQ